MKKELFEELLGSIREAGAILRGQKKPSRGIVVSGPGVRSVREPARRNRILPDRSAV